MRVILITRLDSVSQLVTICSNVNVVPWFGSYSIFPMISKNVLQDMEPNTTVIYAIWHLINWQSATV